MKHMNGDHETGRLEGVGTLDIRVVGCDAACNQVSRLGRDPRDCMPTDGS